MQIVFRPDGSLDDSDINGGTWDFTSPTGSGLELASNAWRHYLVVICYYFCYLICSYSVKSATKGVELYYFKIWLRSAVI